MSFSSSYSSSSYSSASESSSRPSAESSVSHRSHHSRSHKHKHRTSSSRHHQRRKSSHRGKCGNGQCGRGCGGNRGLRPTKTDDCCDPCCGSLGFVDHPNIGYFRKLEVCERPRGPPNGNFPKNVRVGHNLKVGGKSKFHKSVHVDDKLSAKEISTKHASVGKLAILHVPTSPHGLVRGDVWSQEGKLRIVQ